MPFVEKRLDLDFWVYLLLNFLFFHCDTNHQSFIALISVQVNSIDFNFFTYLISHHFKQTKDDRCLTDFLSYFLEMEKAFL